MAISEQIRSCSRDQRAARLLNSGAKMDHAAIYQQLGALMAGAPDLRSVDNNTQIPSSTLAWLGRVSAIAEMLNDTLDVMELRLASESLVRMQGAAGSPARVMLVLNRMLAKAELKAPAVAAGSFISAGAGFDAMATLTKILSRVKSRVLLVDPYMDQTAFTHFAVFVPEGCSIGLLGDEKTLKPGLKPAADAWIKQYGSARPVEVRAAPARSLHDRLILVDDDQAWLLTQSIAHFADRSPATIQRSDADVTTMKFAAYLEIWQAGTVISETA